jgi:predicted polyphosphate/ATP-dependent NAD kinase
MVERTEGPPTSGTLPIAGSLGLLVNPVAGVGGPAGLKGSDGASVQAAALERGGALHAGERGIRALAAVAAARPGATIVTASGAMGADAVRAAGLTARVVYEAPSTSTGADTTAAAAAIVAAGASLLLFVGGDGTARDVAAALERGEGTGAAGAGQPVLGVPAGVKMYSGCFAVSPAAAGALAAGWLEHSTLPLQQREVLDVDEEQIRHGRVDPTLFALVSVPFVQGRTQSRKSATPASEAAAVRAAAAGAIAAMDQRTLYLLGPGGTTGEIARQLGITKTPLGVDVIQGARLVLADASEQQLLGLMEQAEPQAKAVVTVIGGQGFLLGRGNQQLSAVVVRLLGLDPLLVVATEQKLTALGGRPLLVDTGDPRLDQSLAGYVRVITGVNTAGVYPVNAPG